MSRNKKQSNKTLRLILMLLFVAVVVYFGARFSQGGGPAQGVTAPSPQQTAALTLLTEPPQTAEPGGSGDASAAAPPAAPALPEAQPPVESGSYNEVEDVAYYLHTYGHLPENYITKSEAEDAGWVSYKGNLWDVAYGTSIGGDRYWNSDGALPKGEKYYECDVNYEGGYRGSERIVYSEDGDVYYTSDHYESFEKLY